MNAKVDTLMLDIFDEALERIRRPRLSREQMKFDELPEEKKAHNVRAWLLTQDDSDGWVRDSWCNVCTTEFMDNIASLDDTAIGRMFRDRLYRMYGAESMKDDQ